MLVCVIFYSLCVVFKQKTAYEMRIIYWSSDVCSSDLIRRYPNLDIHLYRKSRESRPTGCKECAGNSATRGREACRSPGHDAVAGRARHQRGACSRSEEHTSELKSLMRISYAVFCLKKKHMR